VNPDRRLERSRSGSLYALAVLFAINLLNFFDRQLLGVLGEPIRKEWGLSDTALGGANTAFVLLYAFAGVPLGRLADRLTRTRILAAGVFVWSALTAATGFARSYAELFLCRLGVGVGEASCAPAASSLIGDLFPAQRRARAMSIFMLGLPLGLALSFALGGLLARSLGWRAVFYLAALPGIACALAVLLVRDPPRGAAEAYAVGSQQRDGSAYRLLLTTPTLLWIIASGALHNFAMYSFSSFLAPFLMRYHGLDLRQAGFVGMLVSLSGIPGLLMGGFVGDAQGSRRPEGRLRFGAMAIALAAPLMWLGLQQGAGHVRAFAIFTSLGCAAMYAYYSVVYAAIHDVVEPALRGTAMALYFFAMYLLGGALGPLATGFASDQFARQAAATAGVVTLAAADLDRVRAEGLRLAMCLVPALSLVVAGVLVAASRTIGADRQRLCDWMRDQPSSKTGR
jgi:MFS family permease